jgi:hypothetical protein
MSFNELDRAAADLHDWTQMIAERQPSLLPQITERLQDAGREIAAMFQPYIDLAEKKITAEQFDALMKQKEAEDHARRELKYGPGPICSPVCIYCDEAREWDVEMLGDLPPFYFSCSDLDGEMCEAEEDQHTDDTDLYDDAEA